MNYLVDTDWLIDVFVGVPRAVRTLQACQLEGVGVSIVSHAEIFEGAYGFPDTEDRLTLYRTFLQQFETLALSGPIGEIFGRIRAELRRAGQLIPDLDLLIAATAIERDLVLLTRNLRHFARIPDLRLYPAV
jgi:predicted nucleic acid-binding protein